MGRLSRYQECELLTYLEQDFYDQARNSLLGFTCYTMPEYEINWHHHVLCQYLDKFATGEIKRLMVFMPPRHGKSELVSRRLPAYLLGRDPSLQIIAASYSDSLASQMSRDVQRIIEQPEYQFLFPHVRLGQVDHAGVRYIRNASMFELIGQKGRYKSAGIGTGITGLGAHVAIIDDPVKDQSEVNYLAPRVRAWEWYTAVLSTRLEKDARVLLTMTRWHEDDLAGRLIAAAKSDPEADQWVILNLPAIREMERHQDDIREEGEVLWPSKYSIEKMRQIRASLGSRVWNALYQQSPRAEAGNIINREWWKYWKELPPRFDRIVLSWDLTFKETTSGSYVVGQAWGLHGTKKYLLDQVRDRMGFVETLFAIKTFAAKWNKYDRILIEDKANGPAVIDAIKDQISGIIPVPSQGSKESRVHAVSAQIEAGEVFLPDGAPWLHDYIDEFSMFPTAASDDQVDATTQALLEFKNSGVGKFGTEYLSTTPNRSTLDW